MNSDSQTFGAVKDYTLTIPLYYQSPDDAKVSAMSFELFFDSRYLTFEDQTDLYAEGSLNQGIVAIDEDVNDQDGDPSTDMSIKLSWISLSGNWPASDGRLPLVKLHFAVLDSLQETASAVYIRNNAAGTSQGYRVASQTIDIIDGSDSVSLDVNADGELNMATDGFIILRHMVGFSGNALASDEDMVTSQLTREQMKQRLDMASQLKVLDINGDGQVTLTTDGFIILRYLVGFPASALASDDDMVDATRTHTEMAQYLESLR